MEKIGEIVNRVIKNLELNLYENRNFDISVVWTRILEDQLKGQCYVLFEKDKNLYIKVNGSCYLSILKMRKKKFLMKLKEMGFNFNDIKFVI